MSATPAAATPSHRRVAVNTGFRALSEVIGKVATLVLTIVMLQKLGKGAVGDFGFALAVSQLYWPIAGFGLDRLMLRKIAVDDRQTAVLVPQLNAIKLSLGLLCTVVGALIIAAGKGAETVTWLVLVMGLTLVATLIGATAQSVFMAKERTQDFFLAALPVKLLGSLFGIVVLFAGGGLIAVATTNLIAALIGIGIGWYILGRRYHQPPAGLAGSPRTWWPLARESGPWGMQEVFGQVTFRVGIIVLYAFAGRDATGDYRVAYQLLEATLFLPWSIGTSVLPMIARASQGKSAPGEPSLQGITRGSIELVVGVMVPIAVILGLCAHPVITMLFGEDARPAGDFLPYLAVASVIYGVGHIAGIVALTHLPGRRTVEATALAAAASLVFVFALVPAHEARGAAIAALLTETVLAGLSLRLAVRAAGWQALRGLASIGVVAGGVMAAIVYAVRDQLAAAVLLGGTAYVVVFLALEYRRRGPAWELISSIRPRTR